MACPRRPLQPSSTLSAYLGGLPRRPGPRCSATCCSAPISASARSRMISASASSWALLSTILVLGRPRAGDPDLDARRGREPVRGRRPRSACPACACCRWSSRMLPMLRRPGTRHLEAAAAGAFHRGEHVGRGDAAAAERAAREPHLVLQRARHRLRHHRDDRDRRRLLSRRQAAAADERGAVVPHAARLPDVDLAQQPHAGRPACARASASCSARCSRGGRSGST